jgi:protein-S-isoprenylcysteine O-methyltransferase Ste14
MSADRSDPAVRAARRLERARRQSNTSRTAACVALGLLGVVGPFAAAPITGDRGATVGAVALRLLCLVLAIALWPNRWSATEREHHELESIWREVRTASSG